MKGNSISPDLSFRSEASYWDQMSGRRKEDRIRDSEEAKGFGSVTYLRIATVMASGEVAQGQITSGFNPCD